jgi:hypothetical protein
MVHREMENTYGHDKVAAVNVVTDTRKLDPLLAKYNTTKQKLDDLTSNYSALPAAAAAAAAAWLCVCEPCCRGFVVRLPYMRVLTCFARRHAVGSV